MRTSASHGKFTRKPTLEMLNAKASNGDPGLFGRMFKNLKPLKVKDEPLFDLAEAMLDGGEAETGGDNPLIPSGFTYLGQFVDHDVTLDTTPFAAKVADPEAVRNFRTPVLDLDSLYGQGPGVSPHLYARDPGSLKLTPGMLIGQTITGAGDPSVPAGLRNDLPRNAHGRALIGDERNDENLLVAQTHLAFLKFHNAVVEDLQGRANPPEDVFAEARRIVTWHYQWIVLYDFVERLTEPGLIDRIRHEGRKFYRFKYTPFMPVEFSTAAYRLGHSMVREQYSHNRVFDPTGFDLLFLFTGKSGQISGELASQNGFESLPSDWVIDWRRFYDLGGGDVPRNQSRTLDPYLVPSLHRLPGEQDRAANLAFRNLRAGVDDGLPSGQDIAAAMKLPVLAPADIASGPDGNAAAAHGLHLRTPLWYYILKEAQIFEMGHRLGPVGSRIVAEVFLGIVHGDRNSFLWQRKNWRPTLPAQDPGTFTMADMLRFVGDVSPIDGIGRI